MISVNSMIAVVVINFGSPEATIHFIHAECKKISANHVVIVVDNASTDGSYNQLREECPDAYVLRCFENQGFARGNNQGAEFAFQRFRPSHLLFCNNDVFFKDPDVIDVLLKQMTAHPEIGIIGPQVLGLDGNRQGPFPSQTFSQIYLLPTWGQLIYGRDEINKRLQTGYAQNAEEGQVGWVSGCCFIADAIAFKKVGGFDPGTFLYGEERILSARFSQISRVAYYYPSVTVVHEQGGITKSYYDRARIRKMMFKSASYYYRNYMGTPRWQLLLGKFTLWFKLVRGL